jgi:hypothetical protein
VQSNWNETGTTSDAFIQNKPTLGTAAAAATTDFATASHNHGGVYALEYELMQSDSSDRDMHVWRKNHAMLSDNSGVSTYIIVETNVPQDNASMGGFTLVYQDNYSSTGEGGEIKIYGYWNGESNGGFTGFRYECSNPYHTPTIEVCRNSSSGNTAFFISGEGGSYTQVIAKDLWLGYASSSATSQWGDSWTVTQAEAKDGYTNFDTLNRNDFAAITTDGSTPSLTGGVTAAEIRTLIGAGTGSSNLAIGTTSTTAMAGNTSLFSGAYSSLSGIPSTFAPSSHNHDDRYYTETEVQRHLARSLGWVAGYSTVEPTRVNYDLTQDAIVLNGVGDTSTGAIHKAIRVKSGDKVRYTVMLKGNVSSSNGLYLRLYQYDGDLPDGKTHVSNNHDTGSEPVVALKNREDISWSENTAVPTAWTTYEHTYTAGADGYVSLVVLNWTPHGNDSIYIKQPDIQFEKVNDASKLGGTAASSYITSQRAISSTPTDGATTTSISSDWAFDNVKTAVPANAVFTDTVYTHPTTAGNKHVPTGGSAGQFLKYSASGTATWATPSYTTNTDTVYTHPTSAGNKHIPSGGAAGQFLKYSSDGTATWATPSYTTNTNTTYSAGTGLDLSGTTFSVEPDLRDGITHVGKDSNNYIQFDSTNGRIDFYAGGAFVARMEAEGDLHIKGDVIAFSNIFS